MAERIVRKLGFSDMEHLPPVPLSQRLSWAIMALEDGASPRRGRERGLKPRSSMRARRKITATGAGVLSSGVMHG